MKATPKQLVRAIKWLYAGHLYDIFLETDSDHTIESCGFCAVVADVMDVEEFLKGLDDITTGMHPLMHYLLEKQ